MQVGLNSIFPNTIKQIDNFRNDGFYFGGVSNENNEVPHGYGYWTRDSGRTYSGNWVNGVRTGKGTTNRSDDSMNYSGYWKDEFPEGLGIAYRKDGSKIYEGNWKKGVPNGEGTEYDVKNLVLRKGFWENGIFVDTKTELG